MQLYHGENKLYLIAMMMMIFTVY